MAIDGAIVHDTKGISLDQVDQNFSLCVALYDVSIDSPRDHVSYTGAR